MASYVESYKEWKQKQQAGTQQAGTQGQTKAPDDSSLSYVQSYSAWKAQQAGANGTGTTASTGTAAASSTGTTAGAKEEEKKPSLFSRWMSAINEMGNNADPYAGYATDPLSYEQIYGSNKTTERAPAKGSLIDRWNTAIETNPRTSVSTGSQFMGGGQPIQFKEPELASKTGRTMDQVRAQNVEETWKPAQEKEQADDWSGIKPRDTVAERRAAITEEGASPYSFQQRMAMQGNAAKQQDPRYQELSGALAEAEENLRVLDEQDKTYWSPMDWESYNRAKTDVGNARKALESYNSYGDLETGSVWTDAKASMDELANLNGEITKAAFGDKETYDALSEQYKSDLEAYSTKPDHIGADNIGEWAKYAYYLSMLSPDEWGEEEKQDAAEIVKILDRPSIFNGYGNDYYDELQRANTPEFMIMEEVHDTLSDKLRPGWTAFTTGLVRGTGATSITKAVAEWTGNEDLLEDVSQYEQLEAFGKEKAGIAYFGGELAGSLALMKGIGGAIHGAIGATKLPALAKMLASGAGTFASLTGVQELGSVAAGDISLGRYAADIGIGGLAGAAGSGAASGMAAIGSKLLQTTGLAANKLANTVLAGLSGAAFAGGDTAVRTIDGYLEYGENYQPDVKETIKSVLIAFAFGTFSYLASTAGNKGSTAAEPEYKYKYFDKNMTAEEAKAAFRDYTKRYHPDLNPGDAEAARMMADINAEYDRFVSEVISRAAASGESARAAKAEAESRGDTQAAASAEAEMNQAIMELTGIIGDSDGGVFASAEAAEAAEILSAMTAETPTGEGIAPAAEAPAQEPGAPIILGPPEQTAEEPSTPYEQWKQQIDALEGEQQEPPAPRTTVEEQRAAIEEEGKMPAVQEQQEQEAPKPLQTVEEQRAEQELAVREGEQPPAAVEEPTAEKPAEQPKAEEPTEQIAEAEETELEEPQGERVKGTVTAENVKLSDLRRKFNDAQNTAYRALTFYAEQTGVNIVLYDSKVDSEGNYPAEQGRFQWSDDTIYIDINSGLFTAADVKDLGKYTMLRTFGHEFSHFIEKWNAERYNEFREFVFNTMKARGVNVNKMVADMKLSDKSGKMTPEQATREVIAEAVSDILPDSKLVTKLARTQPATFKKLHKKLQVFQGRLKSAYRKMSGSPREAQVLKENGEYLSEIVDMWDQIAKEAVENYQAAKTGRKPAEATEKKAETKPAKAEKKEPEKPPEKKPAEKKGSAGAFASGDIYSKDAVEKVTGSKAASDIVSKMPAAEEAPAPKESAPKLSTEAEHLRTLLNGSDTVQLNGFEYSIFGMKSTTVNMQDGSMSTSTEYRGTIRSVRGNPPVVNGRALFDRTFTDRGEAVDYMVEVAENNGLLETAASQEMEVVSNGETESEAPDVRGEEDADGDGSGAVRVPSELEEGRVPAPAGERETAAVPAGEGRVSGQPGDQLHAERDGRSGSDGSGESGVQRGHDELTQQREQTHEEVEHAVAEKSTVEPGGSNYVIGDSLDLPKGKKARYKANVEAIRLAKELEAENRIATPAEQEILSKYVGWGGIAEAFDENKSDWSKEFAELKEVLTQEEYEAARGSTLNAHYTSIPVIKAMYKGLQQLGFKGGRMLEPSSGVGNFVGAMPTDMSASVRSWTMVELDNITGLIAKHLYPQADVRIEGFEKAIIPDNFMDVAIGNVPFGNFPIIDRAYPKSVTSAIHNYFFAKSLDKVRPGGIVMYITSSFTMNSKDAAVRKYIAKRADLLGAIRLPNNAFSGNADTQVVTDILVLKKREPGTPYGGVPFERADYDWRLGGAYQNEYFAAHPEMVMGEQVTTRGMYKANEYTVNPFTDRGTLEEQIGKAFESIEGRMDYPTQKTPEKTNYAVERADKKTKQGGFVSKEGKIYQNNGGELVEVQADEKTAKRITGMLQIRDLAQELLNAQLQGQTEKSIADARKALNKAYDTFVKENGFINSPANKKAIQQDPDRFSLYALENWDSKKKTATKADIFNVDTVKPNRTITHVDSAQDGLAVSRNTTGGVDIPLIAKLTGRSEADVTRELIESETVFKDRDGNLLPAEVYLSGNVRAKLRDAQGMVGLDKDYQHNVDALKQVVPKDVAHEQIFVQPGAPWIPDTVYSDFAAFMLGGDNYRMYGNGPDIQIHRSNETGSFTIDLNNRRLKDNYRNRQLFGTPDRSFLDLLNAMMNSRSVTVSHKGADGKSYVDKVATAAANAKMEEIRSKFQEWLWSDEDRTKELEYLYNETYNAIVTPKYDGSTLTVNGLRAGFTLKPHQADAVQRVVTSGGNTLLAHRVGAGKTLEMAAAAMKLKELGIVKKPMFAVPKSLVAQWGNEFKKFFPNAKLLVAEQSDFTPGNRKTFSNRIATGNYDAVIVSYEQFEKIPMSDSFTLKMYREQIDEIVRAVEEMKKEAGQKSMSVKDLEKKRKQLQAKIEKLSDKAKDTDSIEFEQLGIDSIFVDEAHNFKNLFYTTSMNNVSGLGNRDGSKRAFDLYTKVRYLQQLNGGRGIVFATATPVMNSMSEMYIMQKYLQPDLLNQLGLSTFDAWAKQFGEVVNGVEVKPSGQGYRVKQSFSRFKNMSELQLLFRNFSDVLTKIPGLPIPTMRGGKVITVESEAGEYQKAYMKELEKRADNVKNVDPSEDNMLKITSDGRKISYTQRMIDPSLPYEKGCKIYQCADKVIEEYKASKDIRGTQLIFLDMATPKGKSNSEKAAAEEADLVDTESAQLYDDLKARLVKLGIPAKEIAFIHDADTDQKKSDLFADVKAGKVRVLIGSTGKMGVGMNAQDRIVAIHHLDAPWRPGDVEQRDGRAFRQGNMNKEVAKYVYVTKGSFDARLWDILGRKSTFIDQIMNGENVGREVEDTGEVTLSAAEIMAIASDNPLIIEQVRLDKEIKDLESLYLAHNASVMEARKKLAEAKKQRAEAEKRLENAKTDLKNRVAGYGDDDFSMKIGNRTFTDKKEAGESLMAAAMAKSSKESYTKIGSFAGFDIQAIETNEGYKGLLTGKQGYSFNFYEDQTTRMIGRMQKIVADLDSYIKDQQTKLADIDKEIKGQEGLMQKPFEKQGELEQKRARYNEIMDELNPKEEQVIADEDTVEYSLRRKPEESGPTIKQEFSSAATSRPQVAALFKSRTVDFGDTNIDIGGGKYNYTTEYLAEQGTTNMVYDPFNRGREENLAVLDYLRAGNRADTATCANVLNVIKEPEARANVILEVAKAIKEDGTAYFSVFEKDKSGEGRQTGKDAWQNSRQTADYVSEIEEYFDNVEPPRDGVIVATDPKADLPKAFWRITQEEEIEYSTRRNTLSNTEVLEMAADRIDTEKLTDAEKGALETFQKRLAALQEAKEQRAVMGQQYKDQQFTKGGSRAEAEKIRNRMQVMDSRIERLQNDLISLENKDVLRNVLNEARNVVETEAKSRGESALKQYREKRNESEGVRKYRARIRTDVETLRKWLVNPSNKEIKKHVPAEIQKSVADFLDSINLMSKTALRTGGLEMTKADEKYLKNMKKLHDAIKQNVDMQGLYSGYSDLPPDFLDTFEALIRKTEQHMEERGGTFVVNEMSAAELKELSKTIRTLKKFITTMNTFHNNAMFQHVDEAGDSTVAHLARFDKSKSSGSVYKFLRFDYMRPSLAFEHFGEGGKSIEHEFRAGQATQAMLADTVIDFAKNTFNGKEVKLWSENVKEFTLSGGEKISLPVTHIMSLYCLNKRAQAQTHIYGDGIRVANYKADGKVQLDDGHIVSTDDVQKMIDSLTPRQIEVADALQKFMSTECAQWGNYVSIARFDVEQFTEPNYFPINSDGRYLPATADESPDNAGLYALLNMGFTKELKENAKNRIILYNVFDVFANHAASMTQYRSFALPVLDALKWFNYKDDVTSVRDQLARAFGAPEETRAGSGSKGYAESFVINLIRAYNGTAAQGDPYDAGGLKALHRFNRAQIAFNLRVVVQQPLAITRAAMILDAGQLMKSLAKGATKANAEEMERYSGIAKWKSLGFFDTNISRGLTELIKQTPTVGERVTEAGTKGAELADRYTWAAIWDACKNTVKRGNYTTEEAYFQAVTELFEDVIYKTQVVDSVLTKSEFLRAKGFFPRMMGSFMSEPMTTTSMLTDAYYKYQDDRQTGSSRSEAWKKNAKNIRRTFVVYAVGQVMLAAAQAFMDAWRDDDEYDEEHWFSNYFQKWLNAFKSNVIEEMLPFGKIPYVSEMYEISKQLLDYAKVFDKWGLDLYGNDISNGWAQYAKYLIKGSEILIDKARGEKTNYTGWGAVYNLMRATSGLIGYPFATFAREVVDAWNNTVGYFAPSMAIKTYESALDRKYDETMRGTGVSKALYEKILSEADVDGEWASPSQDELGAYLQNAIKAGTVTKAQADAVWASRGWKPDHDLNWWSEKQKKVPKTATGAVDPAYADYKKNVSIYDKDGAYEGWKANLEQWGVGLDEFTNVINKANTDGNTSLRQDELGEYLYNQIQNKRMTEEEANAWFLVFWNGQRSKTYTKWAAKYHP